MTFLASLGAFQRWSGGRLQAGPAEDDPNGFGYALLYLPPSSPAAAALLGRRDETPLLWWKIDSGAFVVPVLARGPAPIGEIECMAGACWVASCDAPHPAFESSSARGTILPLNVVRSILDRASKR